MSRQTWTSQLRSDMAVTNWTWTWIPFFAAAAIFAAGVATGAALGARATRAESDELQHEEKARAAVREEEACAKECEKRARPAVREATVRQEDAENSKWIFITEHGLCNSSKDHNTVCFRLTGARVWKRLTLCSWKS